MKKQKLIQILSLSSTILLPSAFGQETSNSALADQIAALEARIAALEKSRPATASIPSDTSSDKIIFTDDFEAGLSKWKTAELRGGRQASSKGSEIADFSPWRSTKQIKYNEVVYPPAQGKRFATTARDSDGLSFILSKNKNHHEWYGFRYLILKEPVSLKGVKLPVLRAKVRFDWFGGEEGYKYNVAMFGYFVEGTGMAEFKQLLKLDAPVRDWKQLEIDASSVPKDKPVQFAIVYGAVNSTFGASSGLHIDDLELVDDGQ